MRSPRLTLATEAITIRPAYADDEPELRRLAALDSAERVPSVRCCSLRSAESSSPHSPAKTEP